MNITGKQGFVFSLDAGIAFALAICMLFLVTSAIAQNVREKVFAEKNFELWKNTVFAADSLVKNSNEETPLFGSAFFDEEKHRVKSNEISPEKMQKISGFENREFEIKLVKITGSGSDEKIVFSKNSEKKNCLAVERIALVEGKISKIVVVGCN
ncbi:MAG: hypothetical protein PHD95_02130 [Candidatus ainarchaeum sp.]|nr:hypothetical protein [Candidatus ainarchaeum sp.]